MTRLVVLKGGRSVFKLGRVIGESRVPGKMRVQSWSQAGRSWSSVITEPESNLGAIPRHADMTPYQRRVLASAQKAARS